MVGTFKPGDRAIIVRGPNVNLMKVVVVEGPWDDSKVFESPDLPYRKGLFPKCNVVITSLGQPLLRENEKLKLTASLKTAPYKSSYLEKLVEIDSEDVVKQVEEMIKHE